MTESQTTASVEINEPVTSNVATHVYKIVLKDASGQPVSGEDVTITMVGSGGFAPTFHSDEIKRTTNDAGEAEFTWYRRGIFTRGVKATVTAVFGRPGCSLQLERLLDTGPKVEISYVPTEIRISPPRV